MIVQIVRASIKAEHRDLWFEVIRRNATQTRAEEGCEGFQVAEDLEVPNSFVIVEMFRNMDALHEHFRGQFQGIMAALGDAFAAPPDASIHEIASTKSLGEVLAEAGIAQ